MSIEVIFNENDDYLCSVIIMEEISLNETRNNLVLNNRENITVMAKLYLTYVHILKLLDQMVWMGKSGCLHQSVHYHCVESWPLESSILKIALITDLNARHMPNLNFKTLLVCQIKCLTSILKFGHDYPQVTICRSNHYTYELLHFSDDAGYCSIGIIIL